MHLNAAFSTDIGRKRSQNQDSFAVCPDLGLYIVADGMGGHQGGETASQMAVQIIPEVVARAQASGRNWDPHRVVSEAIETANRAIYERALKDPHLHGMGTTTTALLFKGNGLVVGHVGDSRCYYLRGFGLWQATRDHSLVQEKLRAGLITRAEMKTDRMRNVITRSVGFEPRVNVELYDMGVRPDDCFMICSDGLSGLVEDDEMMDMIRNTLHRGADLQAVVKQLVDRANQNGGDDNITLVMVQALKD